MRYSMSKTGNILLTSELETIFAAAPHAPNALAHQRVREAFARASGKTTTATSAASTTKKRVPGPDDDCPICYEGMHGASESTLTFCEECGNGLHKECFQQCACAVCRDRGIGVDFFFFFILIFIIFKRIL